MREFAAGPAANVRLIDLAEVPPSIAAGLAS